MKIRTAEETKKKLALLITMDGNSKETFIKREYGNAMIPERLIGRFVGGQHIPPNRVDGCLYAHAKCVEQTVFKEATMLTFHMFYANIQEQLYKDVVTPNGHTIGNIVSGLKSLRTEYKRRQRDGSTLEEITEYDLYALKAKWLLGSLFGVLCMRKIPGLENISMEVTQRGQELGRLLFDELVAAGISPIYMCCDQVIIAEPLSGDLTQTLHKFELQHMMPLYIEGVPNFVIIDNHRWMCAMPGRMNGMREYRRYYKMRNETRDRRSRIIGDMTRAIKGESHE